MVRVLQSELGEQAGVDEVEAAAHDAEVLTAADEGVLDLPLDLPGLAGQAQRQADGRVGHQSKIVAGGEATVTSR